MGMFVEPIPAILGWNEEPVLLLGTISPDHVLYVKADGRLQEYELGDVVTYWRYNPEKKVWHDVDAPPIDEAAGTDDD